MQTLWQDLRYGVRMALRKPGFSLIAMSALALALVSSPFAQSRDPARSRILAFTRVTVIDGVGAVAKPDFTVVIAGDRIVELGPHQRVRIPKGAHVIDAGGKFLIPGLWDMHVHFGEAGETLFPALIANGVTSVREMGGDGERAIALRERVKAGYMIGTPRCGVGGRTRRYGTGSGSDRAPAERESR